MFAHIAKKLVALTPYRIVRSAPNRFSEIDHCLRHLHHLGYEPGLIVDGGAHLGSFARAAHAEFPAAKIHMIEPQQDCHEALAALAAAHDFVLHKAALESESGTAELIYGSGGPDTGAHVGGLQFANERRVAVGATTLDRLFGSEMRVAERTLLKLDLQGHELRALSGATLVLPLVEVVITEVSFFQQLHEPKIAELIRFFDERRFDLFDVAALSGRTRDDRLKQGDFVFVRRDSKLSADTGWR
jgi:FkbM family methyltransferase